MKRYACFLLLAIAAPAIAGQRSEGPPPRPDFAAVRQRETEDLVLVLGLSATQRPALAAFLAQPEAPTMRPDNHLAGFEERLAERERRLAERDAGERKRIAATRAFYATLDARQRTVFEAVMRLRRGPGGPGPDGPPDGPGPDQG